MSGGVILYLLGICTAASAVLYLLLCLTVRRPKALEGVPIQEGGRLYAILQRGQDRIALRGDQPFRFLMGLLYSVAFYWGIPVFIWRYGFWRTVKFIGIPMAANAGIVALGFEGPESFLYGALLLIPIRAIGGLLIGRHDASIVLKRRQNDGWALLQIVRARSGRAAIANYKSPAVEVRVGWLSRLLARIRRGPAAKVDITVNAAERERAIP